MPLHPTVADKVKESDSILNQAIQEFLDSSYYFGLPITVAQWKIDNYSDLRQLAYPSIYDFVDAKMKVKFRTKYRDEGDIQLDEYYTKREAVKMRFPKS